MSGFFRFSGFKLRDARVGAELRREELALASGLAASSITSYETGHASPSLSALIRLAAALDVDPSELVEETPFAEAIR